MSKKRLAFLQNRKFFNDFTFYIINTIRYVILPVFKQVIVCYFKIIILNVHLDILIDVIIFDFIRKFSDFFELKTGKIFEIEKKELIFECQRCKKRLNTVLYSFMTNLKQFPC